VNQSEDDVADLVRRYDRLWSGLDFAGLSQLWGRGQPAPVYLGDEYAAPLIGTDELDRHWSRVAGRIKAARVSSTLRTVDVIADSVVRAVLLSRWRITARQSDAERSGASWLTWLLIRRADDYRIVHQMEAETHMIDRN
jgi:hypothetical protein